jgi:hypothetical protein
MAAPPLLYWVRRTQQTAAKPSKVRYDRLTHSTAWHMIHSAQIRVSMRTHSVTLQ